MRIGDKDFWRFWTQARRSLNREKSRQILSDLMKIAHMPDELSGTLEENQWLVSRFATDLPPHHNFWKELAAVVNLAFPKEALSQSGRLEKKIHQFRYVISSQQAQYVRKHYKKTGMTDAQALAAYLRSRHLFSYSLNVSARLHNKIALSKGEIRYPGDKESFNIKVLMNHFHTEFILSSEGYFLNELDTQEVTEAGVVNGASFNYGRRSRHWSLDVKPVRVHDPAFRQRLTKSFHSPKYIKKKLGRKVARDYDASYFNQSGLYAKEGQSRFKWVKRAEQNFKRQIRTHDSSESWLGKGFCRIKCELEKIRKSFFRKK